MIAFIAGAVFGSVLYHGCYLLARWSAAAQQTEATRRQLLQLHLLNNSAGRSASTAAHPPTSSAAPALDAQSGSADGRPSQS